MITRPCLCTREEVKQALDVKETARSDAQVDRAIQAASDTIDGGTARSGGGLLHRRFHPEARTQTFDWPDTNRSATWRLWLGQHELISVTSITSGGTALTTGQYLLRPDAGPPYTHVEINLSTNAAFEADLTQQRAISITGLYGYTADTAAAGALAEALDAVETGVDVTDSAAAGVGDVIVVDSERMLVTGKSMLDTGVNIDATDSLTASASDTSITMSALTGAPAVGETILIDSERMLVVDVAGAVLTVKRAWDGSVLTAHAALADIWAPRTLVTARGVLGTAAAAHSAAAAVARQVVPGLVRQLAVGEAISALLQESAGWARTAGTGDNEREVGGRGLVQLRDQAYTAYGRKARKRAV